MAVDITNNGMGRIRGEEGVDVFAVIGGWGGRWLGVGGWVGGRVSR